MGNPMSRGTTGINSAGAPAAPDHFSREGGYILAFSRLRNLGTAVTVHQAVQAYIQWLEAKRYSRWTVRSMMTVLSALYREMSLGPETPLADVTEKVARDLVAAIRAKYKASTTWRYEATLRQVFRCFAAGQLIPENPFAKVPKPENKPGSSPVLDADQLKLLLAAPNLRHPQGIRARALLDLLSSTGIRLGECAALRVSDVDFARSLVRILGKDARERVVPLRPETMAWLMRYFKEVRPRYAGHLKDFWVGQTGRPINQLCIQRSIHTLGERAGIGSPVSASVLRRTFAALHPRVPSTPTAAPAEILTRRSGA